MNNGLEEKYTQQKGGDDTVSYKSKLQLNRFPEHSNTYQYHRKRTGSFFSVNYRRAVYRTSKYVAF